MFAKLKTAKYLKAQAGTDAAEVAFVPGVQKLARVHHYGLRDRVSRRGPTVKYAERPLLGLSEEVEKEIREVCMNFLDSKGLLKQEIDRINLLPKINRDKLQEHCKANFY